MASPVHVPRVNNNDDEVKLVELGVAVGDRIAAGQMLAQVETDKAVVEVDAPCAGFVLAIRGEVEQIVTVGKVLMWIGETADEAVPVEVASGETEGPPTHTKAPTAKALALLREHGLDAAEVPASGERLSVADIERHLAGHRKGSESTPPQAVGPQQRAPTVDGTARALSSSERGMLATVSWHRDFAVPGYIEIEYDPVAWQERAKAFTEAHKLLFSPLLSLMVHRLVALARDNPLLNATVHGGRRHEYTPINIGFTVQAGDTLYLTVMRDAGAMPELDFFNAMFDLQKRATTHSLGPDETSGATIGFSSMARWKVSRHIPVLAPQTSFMVAHTAASAEQAVLGATYDHRVMNGSHVVSALRKLSKP